MTKKLTIPVVLAFLVAISLHSCRSEDLLNSSEEQSPSKFRVFTAQEKETINYAKGFKTLLERYDEINNVQHTAKALKKALKNSSEMADEYVELNIRSQDFTTKTNEKFTLFPLIKNGKVDGIIIAILKENETQVEFLKMYTEAENYNKILELFKEAYLKNTLQQRIAAKGNGNCSSDGSPCDTGEVVITMPGTGGGYTGGVWNGDTLPPGGCKPYENCVNPEGPGGTGGGEGNSPSPDGPQLSPCEKIKEKQANVKYSQKFADLNKKDIFDMNKERGYYEKQPPKGVIAQSGFVQIDGAPGTQGLDLPDDKTGISGLFHSHNNADGSIKIFSPTDVRTFINTFLKNAREYAGSYEDAYSTVVTSEGSYTIKYTGTTHPGGVDYDTSLIWDKWYEDEMAKIIDKDGEFPQNKVEEVFTRFITEVVNKPGLQVFRVTANSATKMTYNPTTRGMDTDDCPQ
ncbi:hypothetical protein [Chryseobacterium carnipullorum]|uniref:DUF4329 domain-containing protein n=1 Tax=Chryseobacterium carnipullorum TaxID=1124835 RepID=A0A376DNI6_CHRCU|nr:hypothetical protein [Chryseobacterium carnipullorum]AZA63320.1 hypothetical protein EG345_00310 [Chryseobacterium carnipullorum]STC92159.1 Uncharacterised protein [Chryseobacterium carnipullorum]